MPARRIGLWLLPLLFGPLALDWAASPATAEKDGAGKPNGALQQSSTRVAVQFCHSLATKDQTTLRRLVDFPFILLYPCKGGTLESWEEFTGRVHFPKEFGKIVLVTGVVAPATYLRSLGAKEKFIRAWLNEFGDGVQVVYLRPANRKDTWFAVLVRVRPDRSRVIGLGIAVPPTKP